MAEKYMEGYYDISGNNKGIEDEMKSHRWHGMEGMKMSYKEDSNHDYIPVEERD